MEFLSLKRRSFFLFTKLLALKVILWKKGLSVETKNLLGHEAYLWTRLDRLARLSMGKRFIVVNGLFLHKAFTQGLPNLQRLAEFSV